MREVMTSDDVSRALRRVGHEIAERHPHTDPLLLIGIHTRGVPLAHRLARLVSTLRETPVASGALDVGMYRDDLDRRPTQSLAPIEMPHDLNGSTVILVDDVLFTGRTVRAALDALTDIGRPQRVQLAVLVDRGHRELPIRADYVGKNLPSSADERVSVRLPEVDGEEAVYIESAAVALDRRSQ